MRPFGGSTISDVRRPMCLNERNASLYAPATSRSLPRAFRRSPSASLLVVEGRGAALVDLGVLLVRQELAVPVAFRPLERNVELFGPDPLEIRLAPRCAR